MEILKRAKGESGDLMPFNASEEEMKEEVNRRTAKAGYTTKYGECPSRTRIMVRPPNNKYRENYDKIKW